MVAAKPRVIYIWAKKMLLKDFNEALLSMGRERFEKFFLDLLKASGRYSRVVSNANFDGIKADVEAAEIANSSGVPQHWIFEIKYRPSIPIQVVEQFSAMGQHLIRKSTKPTQFVLVFPGRIPLQVQEFCKEKQIQYWGPHKLAKIATESVLLAYFGEGVRAIDIEAHETNKTDALIRTLKSLTPGKKHALVYQKVVSDILEFLFCPPLEPPKYEVPDAVARNRRDMIFENSAIDGWWAFVRSIYSAHYIVVDAKNYTGKLGKRPVLELAHYLKSYGCGLFGIIVSRAGPSPAANHAIGENWIGDQKMIVSLSDYHVIEMIKIKANGGRPEGLLRSRIGEFRMGL